LPAESTDPDIVIAGLDLTLLAGAQTYSMVESGIEQVTDAASSDPDIATAVSHMDFKNVGFWGHSLGGGMAVWLAEKAWARSNYTWGIESFWIASYAPFRDLKGTGSDFILPSTTASLHVVYSDDTICDDVLGPLANFACNVDAFSAGIYTHSPSYSKWRVKVYSDCSHGGSCPPTDKTLLADHFTPGDLDLMGLPLGSGHLKYFGSYRNLDALYDCARAAHDPLVRANACNRDTFGLTAGDPQVLGITYMGKWSDGAPATPARACGQTCP
jgi:hypothetical protein